jgi:hypothetical protein
MKGFINIKELFVMDKEKVVDMDAKRNREAKFKRQVELVKTIVVESAVAQMQDVRTFQWAAGIGLYQGLKYRGSLRAGMKAGIASVAVITGCNAVSNIIRNIDNIKNA